LLTKNIAHRISVWATGDVEKEANSGRNDNSAGPTPAGQQGIISIFDGCE